ncbi:MAG TPA: dTDP-4-dehydrorhamnose reductase [Burkholderiales bacterium]
MNVLLTGRNGQVGSELQKLLQPTVATDHAALDLADADAIRRVVREVKSDVIVNAAAYTAVDKAESEPELAMQVNGVAPGVLAEEAKRRGALLVHYSTDYVFDGAKRSPYVEDDAPNPLGVYGRSKLEGEARIRASGCRHLIIRTAWVYGWGSNFVRAILRQAEKGALLRVVNDQVGAPTWSADIASVTAGLLAARLEGTFHASAAGAASWYEVALEILRLAGRAVEVKPVSTAEYGAKAPRPRYSVLDNSKLRAAGIAPIDEWRARLAVHLKSAA